MNKIIEELKHHIPFTIFGALSAILLVIIFRDLSQRVAYRLFYVFHPLHVVLSAMVTTSIFKKHQCEFPGCKCSIWQIVFVGYMGSIGIATLSDSLIPYFGELLLQLPHTEAHIGFIERWWIVNPAALVGIAIAYFWPQTKLPHTGHVLISTWASLFHVLMALGQGVATYVYVGIFLFLFLSVWLPCCVSDIAFPLLFVNHKLCRK
jgi:hypothetical protein